jgi:LysR family transcriptional regulator, benzoate and cis,cis-muconate-responsive activator of ben and cat genes
MMTSPRLKDGPVERAADPLATEAELDRMLELALRHGAHAVAIGRGRSAAAVALLHLPFDSTAGFDTEELSTEGQVLVLPTGHPLTARPHLRMADVTAMTDLPMPRWPRYDGTYPDGPGPTVRDSAQLLQLIALGRASAILPESSRTHRHDGLATVPVLDAPMVTTVIAWPPHSRSLAIAGLVRAATGVATIRSG